MTRLVHIFAATAIALVPVAASAQDVITQEVRYDDLDLTSDAGQATLDTRIKAAIRKVCSVRNNRQSLQDQMDERQCVNKARGEAIVLASKSSSRTLAAK